MFGSLNMIQTIDMHYPIFRSFSVSIIESCGQQYRKVKKNNCVDFAAVNIICPKFLLPHIEQ